MPENQTTEPMVDCPRCEGAGFSGRGTGYDDVCDECGGQRQMPARFYRTLRVACDACDSEGRILRASATRPYEEVDYGPCSACGGLGYIDVVTAPVTLEDMEGINDAE